jgi:predicted RNA binding protein YcfA (HicA-like mRNA interferase family)
MSKKKNGLSPRQRKKALEALGFKLDRDAKGSHEIWKHPKFAAMGIDVPANLMTGNAQKPGHITVPDNPANGTWRNIIKYAEFCNRAASDKHLTGAFTKAAKPPSKSERKQERKLAAEREMKARKSAVPSPLPA